MNYWDECIRVAFDESGIVATEQQILDVIECVEGGYENYSLSTGEECIPNPIDNENKELKKELRKERDKIHCEECKGTGRIISACGPSRTSNTSCWRCCGEGRYSL